MTLFFRLILFSFPLLSALALLLTGCKQDPPPGALMAGQFYRIEAVQPPDTALTMQQAMHLQRQFNAELNKWKGPQIGYKAALTSPAARARFGASEPVRGTLFKKMLLEDGANLDITFGYRPRFEADLLVRVGDESINTAQTPMQALQAIDAVMPFIELPDLAYDPEIKLTAPLLAAINAGARLGVFGAAQPIEADTATFNRLAAFRVSLLINEKQIIAEGKGSDLMGHPMQVVLWLRDSLAQDGITLKKGDLLSLGSLTPIFPVRYGVRVTARYEGLVKDKSLEVSVLFR